MSRAVFKGGGHLPPPPPVSFSRSREGVSLEGGEGRSFIGRGGGEGRNFIGGGARVSLAGKGGEPEGTVVHSFAWGLPPTFYTHIHTYILP